MENETRFFRETLLIFTIVFEKMEKDKFPQIVWEISKAISLMSFHAREKTVIESTLNF